MPLPTLESQIFRLNRACVDILGETIQYKPSGGAYGAIQAHVDYRDASKAFQGAEAVTQDMTIQVLIADVPTRPSGQCRVTLAKVPGRTFKPIAIRRDESGTHWEFELKDVAGG